MSPSGPCKATGVEGRVVFGDEFLLQPFGSDLRNIGYCNLIYKYHDEPEWCHVRVRFEPDEGSLWVTPYDPNIQSQRHAEFSGEARLPFYLKKIVVCKQAWREWKDAFKYFQQLRTRSVPFDLNPSNKAHQDTLREGDKSTAAILADCLPISDPDVCSTSTDEDMMPKTSPALSDGDLRLSDRVALLDWPSRQFILAQDKLNAGHPCAIYGGVQIPSILAGISGDSKHALARDPLVSGLIKQEYLDGKTADLGQQIKICTLAFTEQLRRINDKRSLIRTLLLERECFMDAMHEETINEIARIQVKAAKGNDELQMQQLEVRRLFMQNVREFSLDNIKRPTLGAGGVDYESAQGYVFYVVSPDPGTLTQYLDFVD